MTFTHLNARQQLLLYTLVSAFCFASCTTGKKVAAPAPPVSVSAPDTIETYSCGFKPDTYNGTLPCFGDECGDLGAPLTTLSFSTKHQLTKRLRREQQIIKNIPGKWLIREDCIIEINYEDSTREYYKFHEGINKLERLNTNQESFPGALNKHNYLSKTR